MTPVKILALYDDCDLVTRKMLGRLSEDPDFEIIIAASEEWAGKPEGNCRLEIMQPIKSKFSYKAISSLRKLVKEERPDLIYSVSTKALSTALFATLGISGIKNVGYRGTQAKVRRSDPTYYLGVLNPRVDHLVCETPDIEQYLAKFISGKKLSMATKPFELSWVKEAMDEPYDLCDATDRRLQLVYIGISKGRPHKGMTQLVEAMKLMETEPVHLTVIGEAEESDMAAAPANVTFKGNRLDAVHFLPKADLFVLSSTRDASPRVVREAQACGVPCLVSDIPGARDLIVDGETGMLVAPDSPRAIADAVRRFEKNREQLDSMRAAARKLIADKFPMEGYVDYFKKLFLSQVAAK